MRRALVLVVVLAVVLDGAQAASGGRRYVVRRGDTLSGIAVSHHTTVAALERLNRIRPEWLLQIGVALRLPESPNRQLRPYRIRPGDTLSAIAARAQTTVARLARLNSIDPAGLLLVGQRLRLPERVASTTAPHRIRVGDTLTSISARYGTTVGALARLNGLDPAGILQAGADIRVPRSPRDQALAPTTGAAAVAAISRWADHYGVSRDLALGVAWMESGYQNDVVSAAGAWGVMQITPDTWSYAETVLIGSPVPRTLAGNARVGLVFLHHLLHTFGGSTRLAVAAYFQGEHSLRQQGMTASTRHYVDDVLALATRI